MDFTFNENSQMVKSVLLLLMSEIITEGDIPDVGNLIEVVTEIYTKRAID